MVYIVMTFKIPVSKTEESGKAFLEVMNMFPNLYREGKPAKRIVGLMRTEGGPESTTIWEVTGTYLEASMEVSKVYLELAKRVEGATVFAKTCISIMESLPIIGMSMPK
jgi:hypothetical protein